LRSNRLSESDGFKRFEGSDYLGSRVTGFTGTSRQSKLSVQNLPDIGFQETA
jgi:hypothetical protein